MVVRVAICDDEAVFCNRLEALLARYAQSADVAFHLTTFRSGEELVAQLDPRTQILFLDIGMSGITGMEAARKLREIAPQVLVVFVTSMTQYALEGYRVHAFGFLEKPVHYDDLRRVIEDALRSLSVSRGKNLMVRTGTDTVMVASDDIVYVESFAHRMRIVLERGELSCTATMAWFEDELSDCGFSRAHRCYLVNLRHVAKVSGLRLHLDNGDELPISKQRSRAFAEELDQFIGAWA